MKKMTHWKSEKVLAGILVLVFSLSTATAAFAYTERPAMQFDRPDAQGETMQATPFSLQQSSQTPTPRSTSANRMQTSTDFLMGTSPFASPIPREAVIAPEPEETIEAAQPVAETIEGLPTNLESVLLNANDMATLVSETCKQQGESWEGTLSCSRAYSNGHRATVVTQRVAEGDEFKLQAVVKEFDSEDNLVYKKTIRQRIDYNYYHEDRGKERELIDIIYEVTGQKMIRELFVRQYHLDTGKTKNLTWAQYEQMDDAKKAELIYHASLRYDSDGAPVRGVAEQWNEGKKTASYLDWNALAPSPAGFSKQGWQAWESWIQNVSLQAYLP